MAEGGEAQKERFKEVLVVFRDRRRPIKFKVSEDPSEDKSNLLHAVQVAFSDVFPDLAAGEGTSSGPSSYFFQTESKEWGGLVDVIGEVQDRSTILIKQPDSRDEVTTSTGKAKDLCQTLGKPSKANARVLASLFPACASSGSKRKLNYNPNDECVAGEAHRRKKAATPGQGRAKRLKVVMLSNIPSSIPKGSRRESLKKNGRIVETSFHRCMTANEVIKQIRAAFVDLGDLHNLQFLHAQRDNTLLVAENQHLDGVGVIKLAGCGSLYIKHSESSDVVICVDDCGESSQSSSNTSVPSTAEQIKITERGLSSSSSSVPSKPRTVQPIESTESGQSSSNTTVHSRLSAALKRTEEVIHQLRTSAPIPLEFDSASSDSDDMEVKEKDDFDLQEWRRIRAEQDQAYQESLKADIAKEELKQQEEAAAEAKQKERNEWTQNLQQVRCLMKSKFDCSDCSDSGVKIAFKLPDGSKNEYKFPSHSTVKDMYQYVLSKEVDPPFSLCVPHPRSALMCSEDSVITYKDILIVVEVDTLTSPCYDLSVLQMFSDTHEESGAESIISVESAVLMEESLGSGDMERLSYLKSIGCVSGPKRTIDRTNLYEDVLDMYREGDIVLEYPMFIKYDGEKAVDEGGVQRDMLSAFWAEAYTRLFEGAKTLTPMIHPGLDMAVFPILGRILSHGYLACGVLPVCIALPSLISMVLGPSVAIPSEVIIESFADYVSDVERRTLKDALKHDEPFSYTARAELVNILSRFGCRQVPTHSNLRSLVEQVARYEFCAKPAAALALIHSGIPLNHKPFWEQKSATDIKILFYTMSVTPTKVLSMLEFSEVTNELEERVCNYLTTMVGNMQVSELSLFLRFITGASVCIVPKIKVEFNALSGFGRRPIAHTCDCVLELPTSYTNYEDFYGEFKAIFDITKENFSWRMDAL